jgi:glycine cleavage system H protein
MVSRHVDRIPVTPLAEPARPAATEERARMVPTDLRYTKDHEWVRVDGDEATVGITEYAASQLGDIVFVELPDVGRSLSQFAAFGVVESVKAVSDLFAPVSGEVAAANEALAGAPELVNSDPYGEGWMVRLRLTAADEVGDLLEPAAYDALIAAG